MEFFKEELKNIKEKMHKTENIKNDRCDEGGKKEKKNN